MRTRRWRPEPPAMGLGVLPLLALVGLLMVDLPPAEAAAHRTWQDLLDRAVTTGQSTSHQGEVLWVTWAGEEPRASLAEVASAGGVFTLHWHGERQARLSPEGGWLVDPQRGWDLTLPPTRPSYLASEVMAEKYEVEAVGQEPLLDRSTTLLEVRRRAGGMLLERLWLDDESGLLLRRESYDGDTLLRLFAYLSLDLQPSTSRAPVATRGTSLGVRRSVPRAGTVEEAAAKRLAVLRQDGFHAPERLPGGYFADGIFPGPVDREPLHLIYGDGFYAVSLFQQRGSIDRDSLSPGAEPVEALGAGAVEWPEAVPSRLMWEAQGIIYTLVGDAPRDELLDIAAALPQPAPDGLLRRLRIGLSRLWSLVSPWS